MRANRAREVVRRLAVGLALAGVYVVALSPLRAGVARHVFAPIAAQVAGVGAVVTATPRPPTVSVVQGEAQHTLDVPFGRLWIVTAVALALFGAPPRAHGMLAGAVAVLGALSLLTALAGIGGIGAAWPLHTFLGFVTVPVVAGVALLSARTPPVPTRPEPTT